MDEMEELSEQCGKCVGSGKVQIPGGRRRSGSSALVLDLAKAFERVSLPVGLGLGDALQLPKEDIAGALRVL